MDAKNFLNLSFPQKFSPSFLEKIIVGILLGLILFMPVFFLPLAGVFPGFAKNILLSLAVISSLILVCFLWMRQGKVVLLKNPLFVALCTLVAVYAFSSLLSGSFSNSFFGTGGETTTSVELLLCVILLFLFAIFFRTKSRLLYAFAALFAAAFFVFVFQIFHLIFPEFAITGIFSGKTANLIGKWSDFGIFSGIIAILSLVALEKLSYLDRVARGILYFFLATALFFHALAFYSQSWLILFVITLALSAFMFFSRAKPVPAENFPAEHTTGNPFLTPSFIVAGISFLFLFIGPSVNNALFNLFHIPPMQDVRPSLSGTYQVSSGLFAGESGVFGKEIFFGAGPNRFFIPWQKYRPKEVNYTPWWGVDFNEGIGAIPSALVSTGIVGFLGWVVFLLLFFAGGARSLWKKSGEMDVFMQCAVTASFVSAAYCWIVLFLNTAGTVPFALAFLFSGLFLAALSVSGESRVREYEYARNPQTGFFVLVAVLLLLLSSAALGYHLTQSARSFFAYRNAIFAAGAGDFEKSNAEFQKAVRLAPSDAYYRSWSILHSYRAGELLSRKDISPDELRAQFSASFRASVEHARTAISLDGANYQNWLVLGGAYSLLAPLGIENVSANAYREAKNAYEESAKRNPFNPQIPFLFARIAASKAQPDEAMLYAQKALDLKNDYADALALISQIEDSRGNFKNAIAAMERAVGIYSSPEMLFHLGYLQYKDGKYKEAASVLEQVVRTVPDYANAKYFLGLSYFEFGRTGDALKEFTDIEYLNPGRSDIAQIIENLQNGYAPLAVPVSAPDETPSLFIPPAVEKKSAGHPLGER